MTQLATLKKDKAYLNQLIDANLEGYRAIEKGGHEILPKSDKKSALNRDLKQYFEEVGAPYETWKQVEETAAKYLK